MSMNLQRKLVNLGLVTMGLILTIYLVFSPEPGPPSRAEALFFGFTHCPAVCPMTMARIKHYLDTYDDHLVGFTFVSCDPKRDDLETLASYAQSFHKKIKVLRLEPEQLNQFTARFGLKCIQQSQDDASDYQVLHSPALYIVDDQNRLIQTFPTYPPNEVLHQWLSDRRP